MRTCPLPLTDVRAHPAGCHALLAVLLDRRDGGSGSRLPRHPQRADDDVPGDGRQPAAAQGLLHQSHRRVDDHVSGVRVRRSPGVLRRQHAS